MDVDKQSLSTMMALLLFQVIEIVSLSLDLGIIGKMIIFLYISFIPGLLFLLLLDVENLDRVEIYSISLGISISFLMGMGIVINEIFPIFGLINPLIKENMMTVINLFTFFTSLYIYFKKPKFTFINLKEELHPAIIIIFLPILSAYGSMQIIAYDNNILLIYVLILITIYASYMALIKQKSSFLYAVGVFSISLSLLYSTTLISNYLQCMGSDSNLEYYLFQNVKLHNAYSFNVSLGDKFINSYNDMLSITILPTIYSNSLNLGEVWVFKLIYPILFSFVSVIMYKSWENLMEKKYSFISAFFFMALNTYYFEMMGLNRQIIGEIFFALIIYILISNKINNNLKNMLFFVFGFGLVVSHYAISVIMFISLISIFLVSIIVEFLSGYRILRKLDVVNATYLFVVMFAWYIYTSNGSVMYSLGSHVNYILDSLSEFTDLAAREPEVLRGLGLEKAPTIWNLASRIFAYITQFLILLGVFDTIKRKKIHEYDENILLSIMAFILLGALIVVPGLSKTMNMTRFYHILSFFLAPLLIKGSDFIVNNIKLPKVETIKLPRMETIKVLFILMILMPYFLFQTNLIYEVVGVESWSLSLSKGEMEPMKLYAHFYYFEESDVFGARWLKMYINSTTGFYCDAISSVVAHSYGFIPRENIHFIYNDTWIGSVKSIFLSYLGVMENKIIYYSKIYELEQIQYVIDDTNKVYSNGKSITYINSNEYPTY